MTKMSKTMWVLAGFLMGTLGSISAEDKNWKDEGELSFVSTNGNSKSINTSARNKYQYNWTKTTLEITGAALGSKNDEGTVTEQYSAGEKLSRSFGEKNYIFESFGWEKNRFSGIRNRYDTQVGLGRQLIKKPKTKLMFELGGGYVNEQRLNVRHRNEFGSGRAAIDLRQIFSDSGKGYLTAEYLHNFDDPEDFRTKSEAGVIATLSNNFSLKVSYQWNHVQSPPEGFGRNDTITSTALIITY